MSKKIRILIFAILLLGLLSLLAEHSLAIQRIKPDADTSTGTWSTTPLWSKIDEDTASDSDFVTGASGAVTDIFEVTTTDVTDPESSSGHIMRYRYKISDSPPQTRHLTVTLKQGGSTIRAVTVSNVTNTSFSTGSTTLSGAQADSITDYTDLNFVVEQGGEFELPMRSLSVSWLQLEVPNAPPPPPPPPPPSDVILRGVTIRGATISN